MVTAAAGAASKTFKKPVGDKIVIKSVNASSDYDILFGNFNAYLYKTPEMISIGNKIFPNINDGGGFSGLNQDWPDGWDLIVATTTQTAGDKVYYTIEYEIIPLEVEPKGWGES